MPLDGNSYNPKSSWPPAEWSGIYADYNKFDVWYSGDIARLATYYGEALFSPVNPRSLFWAAQTQQERRQMLHLPVAGDIAATSARLLFGEEIKIGFPEDADEGAKARLEAILAGCEAPARFSEAAECCSALGGVLLKINTLPDVVGFPVLSVAQVDSALPEIDNGILVSCTFWKVTYQDDKETRRLLERHERGIVYTAEYQGKADELGTLDAGTLKVDEYPGIDSLLCRYIPNRRPNRQRRGSYIGASDLMGLESFMDSLDETWTSLMRDIRLGKGRIIAPRQFFERRQSSTDVGNINVTFAFDVDREAYMDVNAPPTEKLADQLVVKQFEIRTEQHLLAAEAQFRQIVGMAGYSPQTFGMDIAGQAESGTALRIREGKSLSTKASKERLWRNPIADLLLILQQVDRLRFPREASYKPTRPSVAFADGIVNDPETGARTLNLLRQAQGASIDTAVRLANPDRASDEQWVQEEVARIKEETGQTLPDALQVGVA